MNLRITCHLVTGSVMGFDTNHYPTRAKAEEAIRHLLEDDTGVIGAVNHTNVSVVVRAKYITHVEISPAKQS